MTRSTNKPNMHRVEKISLQPAVNVLSNTAAVEMLFVAGLNEEQIKKDELDAQLERWKDSERWEVNQDSHVYHQEVPSRWLDEVAKKRDGAVAYVVTRSWHNEMMESVECSKCGMECVRLALSNHQNSRRCRAKQNQNEVSERGLQRASSRSKILTDLIAEQSEVGIQRLRTRYIPGGPRKRSKLGYVSYATPEGIQKAKEEYLPAAVSRAGGRSVKRGRILWRSKEHCIVSTCNTMYVVDVEIPDRIYRRRSLYVSSYSGTRVVYNADGWRVGEPIPEYTGEIETQRWYSDQAVLVVEADDGHEQTIELPHPVDTVTRDPTYPIESDPDIDIGENEADPGSEPEPTSAAFIPGQVVAAENGVVVHI